MTAGETGQVVFNKKKNFELRKNTKRTITHTLVTSYAGFSKLSEYIHFNSLRRISVAVASTKLHCCDLRINQFSQWASLSVS